MPGRRRPGDRHRPGLRARLRQDAAPDHRRARDRGALRREGVVEEDHRVHRQRPALDGRGPDGLRGRRRARASRSASTPRPPRRRCSSPRPSAASCGPANRGETASVFLPSVPTLLGLRLRDGGRARPRAGPQGHRRGRHLRRRERPARRRPTPARRASDELEMSFEALGSEARFDRVLFDGGEFGHAGEVHVGSEEEMDFLGIPGLLEPDQMRELLQQRQSDRAKKQKAARRRRRARHRRRGLHPRAARGPAPRAQRAGRRVAPPHRPGARDHPRRAAQGVRRPGRRGRDAEQLHARIDRIREWATRKTS